MESIQYLERGTKLSLIGDVPVSVEDNPRDGAWIVTRFSHTSPDLAATGGERLRAADRKSAHGLTFVRDGKTPDVLVIVHADDIVGVRS